MKYLGLLVVLVALQVGCGSSSTKADTRAADEKAIRDTETQWVKDFQAKDLDKDIAHYTDDASFLISNAPIFTGKDAIRGVHKGLIEDPNFALDFAASKVEVARSGDLAYSRGNYTLTTSSPKSKKPITEKGKYLTVFAKQTDGSWKVIEDMLNSDAPPAAETTAKAAPAAKPAKKGKKARK
jgi:uncharacterized protein (TIGR02246 family)